MEMEGKVEEVFSKVNRKFHSNVESQFNTEPLKLK